jgi:tetratricopeptide (TPR) repeat protein
MRWIATVTLLYALTGGVLLAGPDEDYLAIYNRIQQADDLLKGGQSKAAAVQYLQAFDALQKLRADEPAFNRAAVAYRLDYLGDKLKELAAFLPSTNAVPAAPAPARPFSALTPPEQAARWQELTNANALLEMKLKEALSVQPAALAPGEMAKAREKITSLEKERDLLSVALDQQKAATAAATAKPAASAGADKSAQTEIAALKQKLDETQKKLGDTAAELNNLKSRSPAAPPVPADVKKLTADNAKLTADNDKLESELAAVKRELADRESHANIQATPGADAVRLKAVEAERDALKQQLAAMTPAAPSQPVPPPAAGSSAELEQLRARLKVLEAAPVPYTAEELAVLRSSPVRLAAPPVAAKAPAFKAHSISDLNPGALSILQDAQRDIEARHYEDAEKKFLEVLRQDENNIYVLFNLGSAELGAGRLDDCEKNVRHALDLAPNDPGNLYLLGLLRYRQEKLDDALEALSRSAALNSTNASTQNYLGCVLADKGLRPQAETAFRKALDLEPEYADAHFNLALVYAAENPPSLALARWHYQKALDLHHDKSPTLEKMLSDAK